MESNVLVVQYTQNEFTYHLGSNQSKSVLCNFGISFTGQWFSDTVEPALNGH